MSRRKLQPPIVPVKTGAVKGPSAAVIAAAKARPVVPAKDKLDRLRKLVGAARDIQMMITEKNEELAALSARLTKARTEDIPRFMEDNGIPSITLEAEGNMPAVECSRVPFYSANIKSDWDSDRKANAYAYLDKIGEGDLIRTEVVFSFPKEDRYAVADFVRKAAGLKLVKTVPPKKGKKPGKKPVKAEVARVPTPVIKEGVNHNSLTAWLKRKVENEKFVPDLEKIGAFVGTVAEIKQLKEKK